MLGDKISRALPLVGGDVPGPGTYDSVTESVGPQSLSQHTNAAKPTISKGDRFWEQYHVRFM
jgi:hypothetical protein